MNKNTSSIITSTLPFEVRSEGPEDSASYVKQILRDSLPKSDRPKIETELKWNFMLDKHSSESKKSKRQQKKKPYLSRGEKAKLGLLKLSRDGWNYKNLLPMHEMWKSYMRSNLDCTTRVPSHADSEYGNFAIVLSKSELIGACIEVVRSTMPSYVGVGGIVVLETKGTFQVVTTESKFKIILKEKCIFTVTLDTIRFTVFGKNLMTRPSERSIKKIKSYVVPDL